MTVKLKRNAYTKNKFFRESITMTFLNDICKMINFISLTREDFLLRYNYISSLEYDITNDLFYGDLQTNTGRLQQQIDQIRQEDIKQAYTTILKRFIEYKKIKLDI